MLKGSKTGELGEGKDPTGGFGEWLDPGGKAASPCLQERVRERGRERDREREGKPDGKHEHECHCNKLHLLSLFFPPFLPFFLPSFSLSFLNPLCFLSSLFLSVFFSDAYCMNGGRLDAVGHWGASGPRSQAETPSDCKARAKKFSVEKRRKKGIKSKTTGG
jgi:hypothetical protein